MWKQSPLSWPRSSQAIQTSAEQITDQVGTKMNEAVSRLTNLESDANYGRHSLSEEASTLLGLRDELESLLRTGTVLTATPYQFQVGTKLDSGCYQNPQAAVKVLSSKLRDHADKYRPLPKTEGGNLHCVALMVTASQLAQFANQLADLASVFPLPDWCQVARQTQALVTNETDKLLQPAAIAQPRFKPMAKLNANPLQGALHWQGAQIATLESLADDAGNVIGKLHTLATKRANKLSEVKAQLNALKNLKGSVYAFSVTGSAKSIATQISQAGAPNNHQFTVVSLLLSHEPMTFFEELLC
ncbi:hypothetical protein [Vibrio lentus]|uniref:hypothetical protein n=1 Tax=Vibrio lentus TaxID=136468 RepID=UPI000C85FB88|nr:hypothetical protein [Vibrio lentus]PMJ62014.1 hypothetical protein BCU18_23315 [Vibrio lentus]